MGFWGPELWRSVWLPMASKAVTLEGQNRALGSHSAQLGAQGRLGLTLTQCDCNLGAQRPALLTPVFTEEGPSPRDSAGGQWCRRDHSVGKRSVQECRQARCGSLALCGSHAQQTCGLELPRRPAALGRWWHFSPCVSFLILAPSLMG